MKKIFYIFIIMLLITTTVNVIGIRIENSKSTKIENISYNLPISNPRWLLEGADQSQITSISRGYYIYPPFWLAQEFKPTKDKLNAVAIKMFKRGYVQYDHIITVSIRDNLNGGDLTVKTLVEDDWFFDRNWVLFNFENITIIPESTYYIICRGETGEYDKSWLWYYDYNNTYDRGATWYSEDSGETWDKIVDPERPEVDFCFVTYWQIPKNRMINSQFSNLYSSFTNLFPILRLVLQQIG
jgi:hypothetical protein